jgi:hypothetical protein
MVRLTLRRLVMLVALLLMASELQAQTCQQRAADLSAKITTLRNRTAVSNAKYTALVKAWADFQAAGCVTPPAPVPPAPLTIACPSNVAITSSAPAPATFPLATTTGGLAPVTVTAAPSSGAVFPLGATTVLHRALAADGQTATCTMTVTITEPSPIPPPLVVSPDGIRVPRDATRIIDLGLHVWTQGPTCPNGFPEILRDGQRPVVAFQTCGAILLIFNTHTVYVQGDDGAWYAWSDPAATWSLYGPTAPDATVGSIRLAWDPVTTTVDGQPLATAPTYALDYGTTSGQYSGTLVTASTTATLSNLSTATTYFFAVKATACQVWPSGTTITLLDGTAYTFPTLPLPQFVEPLADGTFRYCATSRYSNEISGAAK